MRLLSVPVLLSLALAAPVTDEPRRQSSAAAATHDLKGLEEFLNWAHPEADGCASPVGVTIVQTWDGGLGARYGIVWGSSASAMEGVFKVREKEGVWQVAGGFEGDASRVDARLGPPQGSSGPAGPPPAGLAPPPGNTGNDAPDTSFGLVTPPESTKEVAPEYPEEAGRARLIGEARIELLLQVRPDGTPLRARPLRGPDPDLGMRRAAIDAAMRWRFEPARLAGEPLTYFRPVELTFSGLPPESRDWVHRALFHVEAIVSDDELVVEEALRRVRAGEPFDKVAAPAIGSGPARGGDWGFVSAATLPAAVRKALHEARVGGLAGPVSAGGLHYLLLKHGEVYYAPRPRPHGELSYQVLHQKNGPEGEALKQAVESDIADYLAESRRQAYLNEAARVMGIRQVSTDIGQLEIRTDVLDEEETKTLGQVVEATIRAHQEFWAPIVSLRSFNQQVLVYAWARQADHDRLHHLWQADRMGGGTEPPATPGAPAPRPKVWSFIGEYIPSSRILSGPCERVSGHPPVPLG